MSLFRVYKHMGTKTEYRQFQDDLKMLPITDLNISENIQTNPVASDSLVNSKLLDKYNSLQQNEFNTQKYYYKFNQLADNINKNYYLLANIDALYDISGYAGNFSVRQTMGEYNYADIGSGFWTKYMQFRRPEAYSWNMGKDIPTNILNMQKINKTETNNILEFYQIISKHFPNRNQTGGISLVLNGEANNFKEFLDSAFIALKTLKIDGHFVCRINDFSLPTSQLIYLLTQSFGNTYYMKPVSSDVLSSERYLICLNKVMPEEAILSLITSAVKQDNIVSLMDNDLPDQIKQTISEINDTVLEYNIEYREKLRDLVSGKEIYIPEYNFYKAKTIWKL